MLRTIRSATRRGIAALHLTPLAGAIAALSASNLAAEPQFNLDYLRGDASAADLVALSSPGSVLPGEHLFVIYLNGSEIDRTQITFLGAQGTRASPCLHEDALLSWGVLLPDTPSDKQGCVALDEHLPGALVSYNGNQQRLDLSIPQLHLRSLPKGYIRHALRNQGVNALLLNYRFSGAHADDARVGSSDYFFASIDSGLNLGSWRLRHTMTANRGTGSKGTHWAAHGLRMESDLDSMRSRLKLGDTYSAHGIFDSVRFRGAQIGSDDLMLPYSQRSYAPIVRGMAASNARVEIRQDGNLIQALNVAPGPFELADIVPNRMSGTLEVSVIESDGSAQRFQQTFSAVESMLRPGLLHYELNAGTLRSADPGYHPGFVQATFARGLASDTTPQAGLLLADHYHAMAVGVAQGLGRMGSASIDVTHARTRTANGTVRNGQSYRFLYSKSLNPQGTELRVVGHRYSTSGYFDFTDAARERAQWRDGYYLENAIDTLDWQQGVHEWSSVQPQPAPRARYHNKRSRLEATVSQRLAGSFSLTASYNHQRYWGMGSTERNVHLSLNGRAGPVNFGLFLRQSKARQLGNERVAGLSLAIPLDLGGRHRMSTNSAYVHSQRSGSSYHLGANGVALDDGRLGYGINAGHSDQGNSISANLAYAGQNGVLAGTATHAAGYHQFNWDGSGAVVLHRDGWTLAQSLQRTNVLVHAPDGAGIGLQNQPGTRLDSRGFAIATGFSAYANNQLALRTDDLGSDIDASRTAANVIPTLGALVRVQFETRRGLSLMIHARQSDGTRVPIGAGVFGTDGISRGIAGPNGQLFVSGIQSGDRLTARWGDAGNQSCLLQLPEELVPPGPVPSPGYQHVHMQCLPFSTDLQRVPSHD